MPLEIFLWVLRQRSRYLGGPLNIALCIGKKIMTVRHSNPIILQKMSWGEKSCLFFPPIFKIPGHLHDLARPTVAELCVVICTRIYWDLDHNTPIPLHSKLTGHLMKLMSSQANSKNFLGKLQRCMISSSRRLRISLELPNSYYFTSSVIIDVSFSWGG